MEVVDPRLLVAVFVLQDTGGGKALAVILGLTLNPSPLVVVLHDTAGGGRSYYGGYICK